jgi:stearoyl-CoA desaturase (delta-9 desaturase)
MSSVATTPIGSRYSKVSILTCVVLIWFHIQAVAAFWSFSWTNLFVALFLYWVAIGLGISMGYHRLHTHRGFKTYKLIDYLLAICGTLTLEGGQMFWSPRIASTTAPDHDRIPLASRQRILGASGWIISARRITTTRIGWRNTRLTWRRIRSTAADDLPLCRSRCSLRTPRGRRMGARQLGVFLRVVVGLHSTPGELANTWAARASRRTTIPETPGVALTFVKVTTIITPSTSARHGLAWYEFDMTWLELKVLSAIGLVWDVRVARISQASEEEIAA